MKSQGNWEIGNEQSNTRGVVPGAGGDLRWSLGGADPPTTWQFDLYTQGEDVYWTSPTAVSHDRPRYLLGYEITEFVATVQYLFFPPFDVDVAPLMDPAKLAQATLQHGPLPLVIFDGDFMFPDPPAEPAVAAYALFLLDADGYGQASITGIYLGYYDLDPIGRVHILALHIAGNLTVQPTWLGDLNCDGELNAFDIDPFVLALTDPAGYAAAYPHCYTELADCNEDGAVDAFDIDPFVDLLTGG
jgi:hypothetical protein